MLDIFSSFKTTPYSFIVYNQTSIYGNVGVEEAQAEGVFKLRRGLSSTAIGENPNSTATLHIRPSEAFRNGRSTLIGNGIKVNGLEYRIVGETEGFNFDNNVLEHITLTLQAEAKTNV